MRNHEYIIINILIFLSKTLGPVDAKVSMFLVGIQILLIIFQIKRHILVKEIKKTIEKLEILHKQILKTTLEIEKNKEKSSCQE